jgi:hypothetical protein
MYFVVHDVLLCMFQIAIVNAIMESYSDIVKGCRKRLFSQPCGQKGTENVVEETGKVMKGTAVVNEEREKSRLGHGVLIIS